MITPENVCTKLALSTALIAVLGFLSNYAIAVSALESDGERGARVNRAGPYAVGFSELPTRYQSMVQNFWGFDAYRQGRMREIEEARREREAKRRVERERREAQRRKAREEVLERERRYRDQLSERHPDLERHRRRYAQELERRRVAAERRRLERWQQDDAKLVDQ